MRLQPQAASRGGWVDTSLGPPHRFITTAMNLAMVPATERDRELVANLAAERRRLGKAQMMGIGGAAAADQARLLGYRLDVVTVTDPSSCRQRQDAFLDDCFALLFTVTG